MNHFSERRLIDRLIKREETALDELINLYAPWVKAILKKRLINLPEEQEECLNDTFLKAWEHIEQFDREKGELKQWIGAIASYQAIDRLRKLVIASDEVVYIDEMTGEEANGPEETLLRAELREQTLDMISQLSAEDEEIFIRLFFEGKSYDEVSEILGLSKDVLYNRVARGRRRLREIKESSHE